jgi:hypothetical protein
MSFPIIFKSPSISNKEFAYVLFSAVVPVVFKINGEPFLSKYPSLPLVTKFSLSTPLVNFNCVLLVSLLLVLISDK